MYQRSSDQVKKEIKLERMNHEIEGKKKEISAISEQHSRGSKSKKYLKNTFSDQVPKDLASLAQLAEPRTPERTLQIFLSRQIAFL